MVTYFKVIENNVEPVGKLLSLLVVILHVFFFFLLLLPDHHIVLNTADTRHSDALKISLFSLTIPHWNCLSPSVANI